MNRLRATGIDSQKVGPNAPTTWPTTLQDYIAKRAKNVNNFHCTGLTECTFGNSVEDCEQSPFEYVMLNGITNLGHWIFNIIDAAGRAFPTTGFSSAQMLGTFTNKSPVGVFPSHKASNTRLHSRVAHFLMLYLKPLSKIFRVFSVSLMLDSLLLKFNPA